MKDVLLKMILNRRVKIREEDGSISHSFIHPDFYEPLATEIADIVKAFDGWKDVKLTMSNMSFDKDHGVYVWDHKVWEYNDLFIYWYNEIREK